MPVRTQRKMYQFIGVVIDGSSEQLLKDRVIVLLMKHPMIHSYGQRPLSHIYVHYWALLSHSLFG